MIRDPRDPRGVAKGVARPRQEDGPFMKAFIATFGVLIAVTVWMLLWGMVALIMLKLNGFEF